MDKLGPYVLGPNDTPENGIYTGDAREMAKAIPDESVDLVFTDPVYDRIDDYRWLAETAARVLVEGGMVIAQTCSEWRYDVETVMRQGSLIALPLLCENYPRARAYMYKWRAIQGWKPYVWFSKGKRNGGWVFDRVQGKGAHKVFHEWGDSQAFFIPYIERLTRPGQIIYDPFTGGGTVPAVCKLLKRKYLAFEIDPETAVKARQRVQNTQPPLFIPQPDQVEMELA